MTATHNCITTVINQLNPLVMYITYLYNITVKILITHVHISKINPYLLKFRIKHYKRGYNGYLTQIYFDLFEFKLWSCLPKE